MITPSTVPSPSSLPALALMLLLHGAHAAEPTAAAIQSCLRSDAITRAVQLTELSHPQIIQQDNYRAGYDAPFYFKAGRKDIGYATRGARHALIYDGRLYPLASARPLQPGQPPVAEFSPQLADWNLLKQGHHRYLCVSFNFDGLGRSGAFQAVRGAFLLPIDGKRASAHLLYAIGDTRHP